MNFDRHRELIIAVFLVMGTFLTFQTMLTHDFLNIDDPVYVTDNLFVQKGLTLESLQWAFTTLHAEFYHPLTWLSLMLDTQLFGVNPGGYLFSNLVLHILNTLLLFAIFVRLTRMRVPSTFVAILFAIHPLHIESVAWIAERKDVLSTFFWMLTIWCYMSYVRKPHLVRFILIHLVFLMGLLSKPMLVTLPIILLMLDFWPLGRYQSRSVEAGGNPLVFLVLLKEKGLLLCLSAGAAVMTIIAQYKGGGLDVMQDISLGERMSNAVVSVLVYLLRMLWPGNLAIFYPFPMDIPIVNIVGALGGIALITYLCLSFRHKYPYLVVGWLWYLITLLPVLGILKVGGFATADRYTYIPLIGPFIMLSWGLCDLLGKNRRGNIGLAGLMGMITLALFLKTSVQLRNWSDSATLFSHAAKVVPKNDFAYHGLGHIFASKGDFNQAAIHFKKALAINPQRYISQKDLARVLAYQGSIDEGETVLRHLLGEKPDYAAAHYALGLVLAGQTQYEAAWRHVSKAFLQHPQYDQTAHDQYVSLEVRSLYEQGLNDVAGNHVTRAKHVFEGVLALDPHHQPARMALADILVSEKRYDGALELFLGKLSDENLKRLMAGGYEKWPLLLDAKGE